MLLSWELGIGLAPNLTDRFRDQHLRHTDHTKGNDRLNLFQNVEFVSYAVVQIEHETQPSDHCRERLISSSLPTETDTGLHRHLNVAEI